MHLFFGFDITINGIGPDTMYQTYSRQVRNVLFYKWFQTDYVPVEGDRLDIHGG
jgi:hypothetical protein